MKNQSTAKGFAILSAAGFICKVLSLIYVPIQTAIVHDNGNSVINAGLRIYFFMFSLSNAGLPSSISKMVSEQIALGNYKGSKKIFKLAMAVLIILSVIFAILLAIGSKFIAVNFSKQPEAQLMLLTLSPVFIFTGINCAFRGYFQGRRNMAPTAVSQIVEQFFNSLCTVLFVYIFYTYTGNLVNGKILLSQKITNAAAGSAVGTIAGAVAATCVLLYLYRMTRRQRRLEEKNQPFKGPQLSNRYIIHEILRYSFPAIIASIATSAPDILDIGTTIRRLQAAGFSAAAAKNLNGIYTYPFQRTLSLATFVATALMTAIIPAVSKACSLDNKKQLKHSITSGYKALFIFMVPCLTGLTLLAQPIISCIFFSMKQGGANFLTAWSWSNIFFGIITIQSAILIGLGRPMEAPLHLIEGMIAKLFLNYILIAIPSVNMHGAALGSAVGWIISAILNERTISKYAGFKTNYFRLILRPLLFSLLMGVAAFCTYKILFVLFGLFIHKALIANDISLLIAIGIACYVYAFLMIKSKTLSRSEIQRLPMGSKLEKVCIKIRLLDAE